MRFNERGLHRQKAPLDKLGGDDEGCPPQQNHQDQMKSAGQKMIRFPVEIEIGKAQAIEGMNDQNMGGQFQNAAEMIHGTGRRIVFQENTYRVKHAGK